MNLLTMLWLFIRGLLAGRLALAAENLALRQQLAILHRSARKPVNRHQNLSQFRRRK